MRGLFAIFVVLSMMTGLFFLGRYAAKKHPEALQCTSSCGNNICERGYCVATGCSCMEDAVRCPQDCA